MATSTKTRKSTAAGPRKRTTAKSTSGSAATTAPAKPKLAAVEPITGIAEAAEAPAAETGGETAKGGGNEGAFKRRDLIQAVAERSSAKKSDVREVMELVLEEIGKALDRGEDVVLPPLGKITVKKRNEAANGDVLTAKIKLQTRQPKEAESPLAEDGEDG